VILDGVAFNHPDVILSAEQKDIFLLRYMKEFLRPTKQTYGVWV